MDRLQVILLALLQGVTELFPVSSLGHTVILPGILGWNDTLHSPIFLPLLVMLHLGTAVALLTFFWRDWLLLLRGGARVLVAGRFSRDVDPQGHGRELALVIVGTIPAGLIGLLFQKSLERLFGAPLIAAGFLVANGGVLLLAERLWRPRRGSAPASLEVPASGDSVADAVPSGEVGASLDDLSFPQAALIGLAQAGALFPGLSRSGLTMVAGLGTGLSHEAAARFSFLLATPLIAAAGVLEIPQLLHAGGEVFALALVGGIISGLAAYLSVRFLMRYFATQRLTPFAFYCVGAGAISGAYFLLQRGGILP